MTSWANTAASLSRGKRVPHALEGAGTKAIAYFGKGWKSGELARQGVCIIFSTCRLFMALAKAHEAAGGTKVLT